MIRQKRSGSPSLKKVILERRKAWLMLSQWVQFVSVSAASALARLRQATHSLCPSEVCRGALQEPHLQYSIYNNATEICSRKFALCDSWIGGEEKRCRGASFCYRGSSTGSCRLQGSGFLSSESSDEMIFTLKEKILTKWRSEPTCIAVGSTHFGRLKWHLCSYMNVNNFRLHYSE